MSEGTYILRTNTHDRTDEDLRKTYIQLTEAEAAFRIQKSDLCIRPYYMIQTAVTAEAWAKMMKKPQNRAKQIRPMIEKLGGNAAIKSGVMF